MRGRSKVAWVGFPLIAASSEKVVTSRACRERPDERPRNLHTTYPLPKSNKNLSRKGLRRSIFFFHSIAANGNIGLSGQAHWLPVAVIIRNCAPKGPTVPGGHATTRVKQTSASKGPARRDSYPWYSQKGRKRHKCYGAEYCPYLSSG